MVLQPLVENAIRHGFPQGFENGRVRIGVERGEDLLFCTIEDNGIGRAASKVQGQGEQEKHHSRGLELTEERLSVLGKRLQQACAIEIEDLYSENGTPAGTRIKLTLPIL